MLFRGQVTIIKRNSCFYLLFFQISLLWSIFDYSTLQLCFQLFYFEGQEIKIPFFMGNLSIPFKKSTTTLFNEIINASPLTRKNLKYFFSKGNKWEHFKHNLLLTRIFLYYYPWEEPTIKEGRILNCLSWGRDVFNLFGCSWEKKNWSFLWELWPCLEDTIHGY